MTTIPGWFDYEALYARECTRLHGRGTLVEVGCWHGASLTTLGKRAKESGHIVYGVDHTLGSPEHQTTMHQWGGTVAGELVRNLYRSGVYPDPVRLLLMTSEQAAQLFAEHQLDFVFLDAAHDYESVLRDIRAWLPLVKPGGLIAGHDYHHPGFPGVREAVSQVFGAQDRTSPVASSCWEYRL